MILSPDEQIQEYTERGWWGERTLSDLFLENAAQTPDAHGAGRPAQSRRLWRRANHSA